jgi:hypothetical protein
LLLIFGFDARECLPGFGNLKELLNNELLHDELLNGRRHNRNRRQS